MYGFKRLTICLLLCFASFFSQELNARDTLSVKEWRAVWVATVDNIDWPMRGDTLTGPAQTAKQRQDMIRYLDLFQELGFNAIVFQVRPTSDAFYASAWEPWSKYLTGCHGQAPDPFYDPLDFVIEEAHKRGLAVHAWLNPFRVALDTADINAFAPDHDYFRRPYLFRGHTSKMYYDPAWPETRERVCAVVKDLTVNYDLDGIHMDDYFYPGADFDDTESFERNNRGYTDKAAWRRENVNKVVEMLRDTIKTYKPDMIFGISPTASPRYNYEDLSADVELWMQKGWVDYIVPQIYFERGHKTADFTTKAQWWAEHSNGVVLYAGLGNYRLNPHAAVPAWRDTGELEAQMDIIRAMPEYGGFCFFSAIGFALNTCDLCQSVYKKFHENE